MKHKLNLVKPNFHLPCTPKLKHNLPCTLKLQHKGNDYEITSETPPTELNTDNHKFMVSIFGDVIEELYGDTFDFLFTNEPPSMEYGVRIVEKFLETYKK